MYFLPAGFALFYMFFVNNNQIRQDATVEISQDRNHIEIAQADDEEVSVRETLSISSLTRSLSTRSISSIASRSSGITSSTHSSRYSDVTDYQNHMDWTLDDFLRRYRGGGIFLNDTEKTKLFNIYKKLGVGANTSTLNLNSFYYKLLQLVDDDKIFIIKIYMKLQLSKNKKEDWKSAKSNKKRRKGSITQKKEGLHKT